MLRRTRPEIGCWYEDAERGTLFEVVALDDDQNSIAIQYYDGEIEDMELDSFLQLPLRSVEQPEDWSGPYEVDRADRLESDFGSLPEETAEWQALDDSDNLHLIDDL